MVSKEDRVLRRPTAFTTGILGARRTSEPGRAWLLRLNKQPSKSVVLWILYCERQWDICKTLVAV